MDGRHNRRNKAAFSNFDSVLWAGPKSGTLEIEKSVKHFTNLIDKNDSSVTQSWNADVHSRPA